MKNKHERKSKVCCRGLNDIWINEYDGKVRMCGWSNFYIGNLTENTIEEIWNGELAQKFRESMLDGSYRFCNHSKCPYCANDKMDEMMVDYIVPKFPTFCSMSYQLQCNYACRFCRSDYYVPCEDEKKNYVKIENEIKKFLPTLKTFSSNGAGEFFCSNSIIKFIENENLNQDTRVLLETNGSLFNENNWKRIEKLGNHELHVDVTVHSFVESTYQFLSGTNLSVQQVIENLKFISKLRDEGVINHFEIAVVICERNFREMPEYVQKCLDEFSMDTVRLRFFEPYGVMDPATEWFYDVRNERHPYHEEFKNVMSHPIFMNEKVWRWQGETESLQKENPYDLERRKANTLSQLIILPDAKDKLKKFIEKHDIRKIALYGAGVIGKAYRELLYKYGLEIEMIFDTYVNQVDETNYKICKPLENIVNNYDLILVTAETYMSSITEELYRSNYKGRVLSMSCLVDNIKG